MSALLQIEDLRIGFAGQPGPVVNGVSLEVAPEQWTGLIGESGSGKSMTALAVLGLLPAGARVLGGRVLFRGRDLLQMPEKSLREVRGRDVGMIFQNPRSALNPLLSVGTQVARAAARGGHEDPRRGVVRLLEQVEIADPRDVAKMFPHQLSGGMCQRVLIAMIVAISPSLLIADEPTTALDVTVQAQILDLLADVQQSTRSAILLISHDLAVVAERCASIAVMFAGSVVELGPTATVTARPAHPYTAQLMRTYLSVDRLVDVTASSYRVEVAKLHSTGCSYRDRCPHAVAACESAEVRLEHLADDGRLVACIRAGELVARTIEAGR